MKRHSEVQKFLTTLVAVVGSAFASLHAELVDGIAAVVNDDIITFSDIKNMVGPVEETLRKSFPPGDPQLTEKIKEVRKDALNQLIERQLIIQQFEQRGGKLPDHIIDDDINFTIEEQYGRDRSVFIKSLEALGLSLETYRERIRDKLIVRIMQQHEVGSDIVISPFKVEQYYRDHIKDFEEVEKVKLRMIYIKKGTNSTQELESSRSLAQEILVKLSTGSDFASLASIYSESSERNQGGEMGFIDRETLREELREPAFSLQPGQISKVIETKDGFYILQVEEKKPAKLTSLVEARELIERLLIQQRRTELQKQWVASLRRKAYVQTY